MKFFRNRRDDFRMAAMMLMRIPVGSYALSSDATLARAVWAFPLVGALVGALAGLVFWGSVAVRLPVSVAAVLALITVALITGGLHEDGLADFTDGLGGGRTREHRLEIMRDSRIGAYGTLALVLAFLLRFAAIIALASPHVVVLTWIAAGATSRGAAVLLLWALPPARSDGLGVQAASPPRWSVCFALLLAVVITIAAAGQGAIVAIAAALGATGIVYGLARRYLQGHTGDVLGACVLGSECAVLVVASAWWA
jgi:adenosylcobinamide-GDP ribazoletransferase